MLTSVQIMVGSVHSLSSHCRDLGSPCLCIQSRPCWLFRFMENKQYGGQYWGGRSQTQRSNVVEHNAESLAVAFISNPSLLALITHRLSFNLAMLATMVDWFSATASGVYLGRSSREFSLALSQSSRISGHRVRRRFVCACRGLGFLQCCILG